MAFPAKYSHYHQTNEKTQLLLVNFISVFFFSSILATTIQILKVSGSKNNFLEAAFSENISRHDSANCDADIQN